MRRQARNAKSIIRSTSIGFVLCCLLFLSSAAVQAQSPSAIGYGDMVEGEIGSRFGEEWFFYGCKDEVVQITMQSSAFSSLIKLYGPTALRSLAESRDVRGGAQLEQILPVSGLFSIVTTGKRASDRGAYQLSLKQLQANDDEAIPLAESIIYPGKPVEGEIATRFGQEWNFRGCKGDLVTVSLESEEFDTYLELYEPGSRDPLASDDNSGGGSNALIEAFSLPETGYFTLIAGGAELRARGAYRLSLQLETPEHIETSRVTPTATPTATPTRRATATPRPTVTPSRTPTPASGVRSCVVRSDTLNLRSGPGTNYNPPIFSLAFNTRLNPLGRNSAATWIQVQVATTGATGWVSGGSQYVTCNFDISTLPAVATPPTPTPQAQATPTAIPTPPYALSPGQGTGGVGSLVGDIFTVPGFITGFNENNDPIFSQRLIFRMFVRDQSAAKDGDGVDRVEVQIRDSNNKVVYSRTERVPGYCVFGGNDTPEDPCRILDLTRESFWPETGNQIRNGSYQLQFSVFPKQDSGFGSQIWELSFEIQRAVSGGATFPKVLFDGHPAQSANFCSGFRTECNFAGCASGQRLVYGPFCRGGDYPDILNGLYEITVSGSGSVKVGATDYGTFKSRYSFGEHNRTLPTTYRFCWPGRASDGYGFEIIVESQDTNARVDGIKVTYVGPSC
jgi:hypothetical protein